MHLAINATEVGRRRGGNESYVSGLLEGLAALETAPRVSLLTCTWNGDAGFPAAFTRMDLGKYRRFPFLLWQQTSALRRLRPDWYLANFSLPPALPCRGAVVAHDLSFRAHPEYFPRLVAWYTHLLTAHAVRRADRVLTDSEFSRAELLRFYPASRGKVSVIPLGVSKAFRPAADEAGIRADLQRLARYSVRPPYILAVGNIHPRKNLPRLLEAYMHLRERGVELPPLVWAGIERWSSGELLSRGRAAGVVMTGFVRQEDLPALYRQALLLVYPSLYEGFGLPPLEAMACGTPVITSKTSSLPEVVGEAALKVNPEDTGAISAAIHDVLSDIALRTSLSEAGIERAAQFTWARSAQRVLDVLGP